MRAVVQRIAGASVTTDRGRFEQVGRGLLVYLGAAVGDAAADAEYLAGKVAGLRIFPDEKGLMNLSVTDVGGEIMSISAFSLLADARKGRRPSFVAAGPGEHSQPLYDLFCDLLSTKGIRVAKGDFGAMMQVQSVNDGPICILLDSKRVF